jgi:hypothetical protein
MTALASTFNITVLVTVEVLSGPTATGLCRVCMPEDRRRVFIRHLDYLTPLNDEARKMLGPAAGRENRAYH